jgi:hypothetical protein
MSRIVSLSGMCMHPKALELHGYGKFINRNELNCFIMWDVHAGS